MSPTGPKYAGAAVGAPSINWGTVSNAIGAPDGNSAFAIEGPGGGGGHSYLTTSQHGFSLPSYAVIDGIQLDGWVSSGGSSSDDFIAIQSGTKSGSATPNYGQFWPASTTKLTWGGPTSLWGVSNWTPADINSSSFGAVISGFASHGTENELIDAVAITIYWHAAPTNIPRTKYYIYKVFDNLTGAYLGNLPNVSSDFAFSQDINTGGSQISVTCAISADTSALPVDTLTDEAGNILTDESNLTLTDEGQSPFTGIGTGSALIRNGNKIQVWEYGYFNINGKLMFSGLMERGSDSFGGDTGSDSVTIVVYSDGSDMDNHLVRGFPYTYTADQTQNIQNGSVVVSQAGFGAGWQRYGQTWKVGAAVTNLAAIAIYCQGTANVTINVYASPSSPVTPLATVTQFVNGGPLLNQFNFALPLTVTPGQVLFFTISVDAGQSFTVYYDTATVYTNGTMYSSTYGGGGGGSYGSMTGSIDFKTFSGSGSTTATFSSVDPTSSMLTTIMSGYNTEGGLITVANMQSTGLTLNYGFNTNTVYESLQGALAVSPSGFYYYVDLGLDLLYFQRANTTADFVLTKGVHINKLTIVRTIEYVINACYVIGKDIAGTNVYTLDTDATSIALYGLRLKVHTDNNIPDVTAAHAVGSSVVKANKDEQYQTVVNIPDKTMDTTLLVPGKIIGFNGFATYVDFLLAQIVHRDYIPGGVSLTLGILPKRETDKVEQVVRGLVALNTITNPTSPS